MCSMLATLALEADLEEPSHLDWEQMAGKSCIGVSYHVSVQALHKREQAPLDRN